jgi:hypothetical protein
MAYATHKRKSLAQRRLRNARVEEQPTAHWYIIRTLRWMHMRMPWGPWKDICYQLYRKPVITKLCYINGQLVSRQRFCRINLDVQFTPDHPRP